MPDIGMAPAESAAETDARLRAERIAELRALCEDVLEDLIQDGRGLAAAVAQRAEKEINDGFSEYHGTMVMRGAGPATKGFMQVSQSVRQSIRLLRDVLNEAWWADVTAPVATAHGKAEAGRARDEAEADLDERETAERAERAERAEEFGRGIGPGQIAEVIAGLRERLAEVAEAAGIEAPGAAEAPLPSLAAKPHHSRDEGPPVNSETPNTSPDPPD